MMYSGRKVMTKQVGDGNIIITPDMNYYLTTVETGPIKAKNQFDIPSGTLRTSWESFFNAYNTFMEKNK
jgi:hypothetical protein